MTSTLLEADSPPATPAFMGESVPRTRSVVSTIIPSVSEISRTCIPWKLNRVSSTSPFTAPVSVAAPFFLVSNAASMGHSMWIPESSWEVPRGSIGMALRRFPA